MRIATSKNLQLISIIVEVVIFCLTVGLAVYFAQKYQWVRFTVVVLTAAILFTILQVAKSEPMLTRLRSLEQAQFELIRCFSEYGIEKLYNIQSPSEQDMRNQETRAIIALF